MIEVIKMAFVKADSNREKEELLRLVNESEDARKAYEEFQAKIALQQQLVPDSQVGEYDTDRCGKCSRIITAGREQD